MLPLWTTAPLEAGGFVAPYAAIKARGSVVHISLCGWVTLANGAGIYPSGWETHWGRTPGELMELVDGESAGSSAKRRDPGQVKKIHSRTSVDKCGSVTRPNRT